MSNEPSRAVSAQLKIQLLLYCPHCGCVIDLLNSDDTGGVDHNEAGELLAEVLPDGSWSEAHERFALASVTCTGCNGVFSVQGIEW